MQPEFAPEMWWRLLVVLGIGSTAVVALAAMVGRLVRSAAWQRTVWQGTILGLLALVVLELSGTRAGMARLWSGVLQSRAPVAEQGSEYDPAPALQVAGARASTPDLAVEEQAEEPFPKPAGTPAEVDGRPSDTPKLETAGQIVVPVSLASGQAGALTVGDPSQEQVKDPPTPEPAAAPTPLARTQSALAARITTWWLAIWALGALVVLMRVCIGRLALLRFRQRCKPVDETLCERVRRLGQRLGIRRPVRVLAVEGLGAPVVFGGLHPAIILPGGFTEGFDPQQQEAMLIHELAHLAAGDPAWRGAAMLACAVLWWQPLAWWSRRKLGAASEAAADEASLLIPEGPRVLAASLVVLGRRLVGTRPVRWLSVEGSGFRSDLGRRVERLLTLQARSWQAPGGRRQALARYTLPVALALVAISCTAWTSVQAPTPYPEGGTTMSVLRNSWRSSLAAAALWAVLGPTPAASVAQDRPDLPNPPPGIRQPDDDRPPSPDREQMTRRLMEIKQQIQDLGQAGEEEKAERLREEERAIRRVLRESESGSGQPGGPMADRERMTRRLEQLKRQIKEAAQTGNQEKVERLGREAKQIEMAFRQAARTTALQSKRDRERMMQRLLEIKHQVPELEQAGQHEQAERLKREAKELMRAMKAGGPGFGPGERPEPVPPGDIGARIQRLQAAAENLAGAGFPDEAEHVMQLAQQLEAEAREGPRPPSPEPGRMGPPPGRPVEPGEIQDLRNEVQQMHREMQELREQMKLLLERERPRRE